MNIFEQQEIQLKELEKESEKETNSKIQVRYPEACQFLNISQDRLTNELASRFCKHRNQLQTEWQTLAEYVLSLVSTAIQRKEEETI